MSKYVKISRSLEGLNGTFPQGSYIQPMSELKNALDGEFCEFEGESIGSQITFEVIDMTEEEYAELDEFTGW